MDHGFGDVEAPLVVADKAAPADHPAEGALHHPPPPDDLEAAPWVGPADDLYHEVEERCLVEQLRAVVGGAGEEVLQPRPAFADGVEGRPRARAVRHVGGGEVHHQKPTVGVHRDVAFAPDDALAAVEAAVLGEGRLHGLAVQHAAGRASLASRRLATQHQRDIVDRAEQQVPDEPAKPPANCLPRAEMHRQRPPAARAARHVADRVQHLARVHRGLPPTLRRLRHQRLQPRPFLVRQVRRVTLRSPSRLGHPATGLSGPRPGLKQPQPSRHKPFSNGFALLKG